MQYAGRLSSGVSGTIGSVSRAAGSVWGRGGYSESGFLEDDDEPNGQKKRSEAKSGSPRESRAKSPKVKKEADKEDLAKKCPSDTWDQAQTVKAQLEAELKRESAFLVTRTTGNSSPSQNHRRRSGSSGTPPDVGLNPLLGSDAPWSQSDLGDVGGDKHRAPKTAKPSRGRHKKGSPDLLFAVPGTGFPDSLPQADKLDSQKQQPGEVVDPWGQPSTSPNPEVATVRPVSQAASVFESPPAPSIWDSAPSTSAWDSAPSPWPQKTAASEKLKSTEGSPADFACSPKEGVSPRPPTPPSASATAAANSLADGFAEYGVTEGFRWGKEADSPNGDMPLPTEKAAENCASPAPAASDPQRCRSESSWQSSEPTPAMFDEAILAALVNLPQQSLIGVLRRLAQSRPVETEIVFSAGSSQSTSDRVPPANLRRIEPAPANVAPPPAPNVTAEIDTAASPCDAPPVVEASASSANALPAGQEASASAASYSEDAAPSPSLEEAPLLAESLAEPAASVSEVHIALTSETEEVVAHPSSATTQLNELAPNSSSEAQFAIGDHVRAKGLKVAAHLNGRAGTIREFDTHQSRYVVDIGGGEHPSVKPDNLEKVASTSPVHPVSPSGTPPPGSPVEASATTSVPATAGEAVVPTVGVSPAVPSGAPSATSTWAAAGDKGDVWPATLPSAANLFDASAPWPSAPATSSPQAISPWPAPAATDAAGSSPAQLWAGDAASAPASSAAEDPWPASGSSPWPTPASGTKIDWPAF